MYFNQLLLIITFCFSVSALAATVYKNRDAEGNIIFSDIPGEGAEEVIIQEAQTLDIPMPKRTGERRTTKLSPKSIHYTEFKIISPEDDTTIHNNQGIVNISLEMSPELNKKHDIIFLLDGIKVSKGKSLQFATNNIDRGTHSIMAVIKNEMGKVIQQSNKVTFHLRKASKLFKNRADADISNSTVNPASAESATPVL